MDENPSSGHSQQYLPVHSIYAPLYPVYWSSKKAEQLGELCTCVSIQIWTDASSYLTETRCAKPLYTRGSCVQESVIDGGLHQGVQCIT